MTLTEKLCDDLKLIAQAGADGWRLIECREIIELEDACRDFEWSDWKPFAPHANDNILRTASSPSFEIRIKEQPDSFWRALEPGEKRHQTGDYIRWKSDDGSFVTDWKRVEEDEEICLATLYLDPKTNQWLDIEAEFRTFRPRPEAAAA